MCSPSNHSFIANANYAVQTSITWCLGLFQLPSISVLLHSCAPRTCNPGGSISFLNCKLKLTHYYKFMLQVEQRVSVFAWSNRAHKGLPLSSFLTLRMPSSRLPLPASTAGFLPAFTHAKFLPAWRLLHSPFLPMRCSISKYPPCPLLSWPMSLVPHSLMAVPESPRGNISLCLYIFWLPKGVHLWDSYSLLYQGAASKAFLQ